MKNIIHEKPTSLITGRTKYSCELVHNEDIENKRILDIGCGFGWFVINALHRGADQITGMEISQRDLETVQKYIKQKNTSFCTGTAIDLPFDQGYFDSVVSWEVIEHIPKGTENRMFSEVARVLKNQGVFYLSTPFASIVSKIFDPAWLLLGHRHYTDKSLLELAENNGFAVERIVINGGWWEIISVLDLYIAKWVFRRKPFAQQFIAEKLNKEYAKEKGFTNIFLRLRKRNNIED